MAELRMAWAVLVMGVGAAAAAVAPSAPALAQATAAKDLQLAVDRYARAWASRDPAQIAALHTGDSVFHLVIDGEEPVTGRAAIAVRFAGILADNPAYSSTPSSVAFGSDFVVIEYDFVMDPTRPFVMGRWRYEPGRQAFTVPAIDIITFRDGLVARKVTYLDTAVVGANSHKVTRTGVAE